MDDLQGALMAGSLALAFCLALWFGRRRTTRNDLRRMLGAGACLGGASLLLSSLLG